MADLAPKAGQTVQTQDGRQGIIRYSGPLHIATGEWLGLELPDSTGKNDGSVKGERYFQCAPGFGIFVRKESVVKIVKQAPSAQRPNGATPTSNGSAAKPRPSSVNADVARKRQSLMGAGSGSTAGSRLSLRSPTKSPTKQASSASSAASTPRTGTPATTARTSDSSTKSRLSTTGRTSMGPPPAPAKTTIHGSRPSIGGVASRATLKPTPSPARPSMSGPLSLRQPRPGLQKPTRPPELPPDDESIKSPTIEEEDREDEIQSIDARIQERDQSETKWEEASQADVSGPDLSRKPTSLSRTTTASVESRTADKREVEQLKAKIRTLEKKAMENRDRMKTVDALQNDKDRYETIIQTLQKKLKGNQQEMSDLKAKYEDAENRAGQGQGISAEHESEIELATLDKEMAEERAEMYHAELEALKIKHEELELELDIVREENRELGSVMSPEDKANAGWMQMEKEQERLRQALILLRDMSQTNESGLRSEIRELQETIDEMEVTTSKYDAVAERLARTEATNKHLMEQLEVAEANDDVVVAMETQREQTMNAIERLKKQIQDYEEHIQVTDELESFHVEEEKRLHYQLDESEALLNEKHRQSSEQEKVIEDLEYTLTKFRDVVQGLQSDIDELRRSRDISELEAHEMSSKSRAMIDLNLQLQNSASKTQLKTIDYEMGKMHAEQARSHLDIVQLFVPESFDTDRNPVLALLCFKRIISKAALIRNLLAERMRDRPHLAQDDPFMVFDVMEKMSLIASSCDRSIQFMSTCSTEEFGRYSGALHELEPVERSMTSWVEALKRDELGSDGPEFLQRMIDILQDLAEKLISETGESKAAELIAQSTMVESFAESTALQISTLVKAVQGRLGCPTDEDEESVEFDKRMDQFGAKARTIKYLSSKATQMLVDLRSGSMCLGETAWLFFEEAESVAEKLAAMVREIGKSVIAEFSKLEHEEPLSYNSTISLMTRVGERVLQAQDSRASMPDEIFTLLAAQLQGLQSKVDDLQTRAADITSAVEFESAPSPWTIRAKEVRAQKIISQDTQEELTKLKAKAQEQLLKLTEKDKLIEEQQIKVELLESRSKEAKVKDADAKALKDEMEKLRAETSEIISSLEKYQTDFQELRQKRDAEKAELEALKVAAIAEGGAAVVSRLGDQSETTQLLRAEVDMLQTELLNLQAAVRYLKMENQTLKVPVDEVSLLASRSAWLQPENLGRRPVRVEENSRARQSLKREGEDVLDGLIELAESLRPVRLKKKEHQQEKAWQRMEQTTRWQVARQREELERWTRWKDEVVRKGRVETRVRAKAPKTHREGPASESVLPLPLSNGEAGLKKLPPDGHGAPTKLVRIVQDSP